MAGPGVDQQGIGIGMEAPTWGSMCKEGVAVVQRLWPMCPGGGGDWHEAMVLRALSQGCPQLPQKKQSAGVRYALHLNTAPTAGQLPSVAIHRPTSAG